MTSGRPDASVLAGIETVSQPMPRPGIGTLAWWWRYELILTLALTGGGLAIALTLGTGWLIGIVTIGLLTLVAVIACPPSRRRLAARAWCLITPHRIRSACANAWVQSRNGKLPMVLWTSPAEFGERVTLLCPAGLTAADLRAARDILSTACWAPSVRVLPDPRRPHIVTLEIVRRKPSAALADAEPMSWPRLPRGDASDIDAEEPVTSSLRSERPPRSKRPSLPLAPGP